MATWDERIVLARQHGWKVVEKEHYNPGGTTYALVLVDDKGVEHGRVEKTVQSMSLGKQFWINVPDPDAPAWNDLIEATRPRE